MSRRKPSNKKDTIRYGSKRVVIGYHFKGSDNFVCEKCKWGLEEPEVSVPVISYGRGPVEFIFWPTGGDYDGDRHCDECGEKIGDELGYELVEDLERQLKEGTWPERR